MFEISDSLSLSFAASESFFFQKFKFNFQRGNLGKRVKVADGRVSPNIPGLVVMGGDSCSEGRGFESQHRILDGHYQILFVVKIVMLFEKEEENIPKKLENMR